MVVSKPVAAAASAPLSVHASTGPDIGFDCVRNGGTCRWGDYAGATPDPAAGGIAGAVWFSSMQSFNSNDTTSANWTTWNFAATP